MLPITAEHLRLFLHVLAASVWVGGQLSLAGLVPAARTLGDQAPRVLARRFNSFAWPAYGLLVVTGIWNLLGVSGAGEAYAATLGLKVAVALASGVAAALHATARSRRGTAVWGAAGALSALAALFLGVVLEG